MNKAALRKSFLQQRMALTDAEYERRNEQLCSRFFENIDLATVRVLHTFLPMRDKREPDTLPLVKRVQREFPSIKIAVPRVNASTNELENFYLHQNAALQKSKWGIDEPLAGEMVKPEVIDLVVVPLLAFDLKGHRVGYGKGFYDKFLHQCSITCSKVGLSLFSPVAESIDAEEHDVELNVAITPDAVYTFA